MPKREDNRQQDVAFTVRCFDAQEKQIVEAAQAAGLGKGPYLIRCGLAMAPAVKAAATARRKKAAGDPVAAILGL